LATSTTVLSGFNIIPKKDKQGNFRSFEFVFVIGLHKYDLDVLTKLQSNLRLGRVTKKQKVVISTISLVICLLVLSFVFTLYLAINSLLFIDFLTDTLTPSSVLSLQCAAIPLLVYDNAEKHRKEIIKDNSNKSGVYR